ncbi:DNA polymerase III subunit beta [Candidatus Gottesmanbacteria bacterium]|nr:DNA polymerase III subunit beta [Candidatus Gottesmanbacteria bacterium]
MHFSVLKENINKALSIVSKTLSTKPQMPILSCLLLKAKDGKLQIFSTNLELGIIYEIPVQIEKEGEIAVPGKLLADFIATLQTDKIEFEAETSKLTVKTKTNKASFTTANISEFPPFLESPENKKKLPFNKIKDMIIRTIFAASIDEARPILTGVKTTLSQGKMFLTATDGYRLSKENITLEDTKEDIEIILPAQSLSEIVRIAQEVKADDISFAIVENKNQVVFTMPSVQIFTRLIDGEFPNTDKIIPQSFKTRVVIDKDIFSQAVKTASLFARGAANIIKINIGKDGLKLSANNPQIGEDEDSIEAKVEGEETEIAFNFRFLLDLLANFPGSEVVFESSGPLNPGVFKPKSDKINFLHIIMPVRVQD